MRAYAQFAQLVAEAGGSAVFGVMGDGNMHWVAAYAERRGCAWYPAWHEAGAVWMADGWARVTGGVGVATVTMGPGLAQALPAVMTAARARSQVVVVTAALADVTPPLAQWAPQRELVRAAGAEYVSVTNAAGLARGLAAAYTSARAGRPAVLAVDLAVFEHAEAVEQDGPEAAPAGPDAPTDTALDAAAAAVRSAEAPLFLLGAGAGGPAARAAALALGRQVGAAFGTTIGGRTALPDEPWDLGVLGMMGGPAARAVADRADLVLVLGAALDRYNTDDGRLGANARLVRVDRRPPGQLWSPAADPIEVTGEVPDVLGALGRRLVGHHVTGLRTDGLRRELAAERARTDALAELPTADGPNPWAVVAQLDELLPGDAHVVVGIGHFWYFVAPYLRPAPARTFHFTTGFAAIGQAMPAGVGAALAPGGGPVVVIEGDGSLAMNLQELQAAVRHRADLLVVVLDNQAYGSEYHKLALAGLDPLAGAFDDVPFDLVAVAASMGATARRADSIGELRAALGDLVPARGVRLLDARISVSTVSETYARRHGTPPGAVDPAGSTAGPSHPVACSVSAAPTRPAR